MLVNNCNYFDHNTTAYIHLTSNHFLRHPNANSRPTFDVLHSALEDIESTPYKMDIMAYVGAEDDAYSEVQMIYDNTAD